MNDPSAESIQITVALIEEFDTIDMDGNGFHDYFSVRIWIIHEDEDLQERVVFEMVTFSPLPSITNLPSISVLTQLSILHGAPTGQVH